MRRRIIAFLLVFTNLGAVAEGASNRVVWDGGNMRSDSSRTEVGTSIQVLGDVRLSAGNDLNAKAASVVSTQGALLATAGNNVNLTAGQANQTVDEAHRHKGSSPITRIKSDSDVR